MKNISTYITEKLKISTKKKTIRKYVPESHVELSETISNEITRQGLDADLNVIDVSKIENMKYLFAFVESSIKPKSIHNIDISEWDVSNVKTMNGMFYGCMKFNADLYDWDVSNVTDMPLMFYRCRSFDSDLSEWDVSKATNMELMFFDCWKFNSNLSHWNVGSVRNMKEMFMNCKSFNNDLSEWNVDNVTNMQSMFTRCSSLKNIPAWYGGRDLPNYYI